MSVLISADFFCLEFCLQVAEKRKTLLDDLAIRYQKDADVHREKIQQMEEEFEAEITTLSQQLEQEKVAAVNSDAKYTSI